MFRLLLLTTALLGASAAAARADIIYVNTTEHSDVEVGYDSATGRLGLELHFDDLGVHYDTNQVLTVVGPNGRAAVPPGYGFLGLPTGAPFWSIPQNPEPDRPILGVGAAEDDDETPDGFFQNPLRMSVVGVRGPGDVAIFRDTLTGPVVFANSADGLDGQDAFGVFTTGHQDYSWAFTAPGFYQVDLQVSGVRTGPGGTETSDVYTLFFAVDLAATPEPASVAVFALAGGVGLIAARRRAHRTGTAGTR